MKKFLIPLLCLICLGCASMRPIGVTGTRKPTVTVDDQNVFISKNPDMKLKVDKSLEYAGQTTIRKSKFNKELYIFNKGAKKLVVIVVNRVKWNSNNYWRPIEIEEGKNGIMPLQTF